ncbi:MAG: D-alanyl-D-alanine carboxypeptidase/D-alanyl-D-alanine-endopeptidase [Planctomycetaceae bacterium]|nr:D-alanyl-D-alanine carboxypeptidase/D-alanyl-D-alanine-endopeptidase [Planctomycetaceae bacterium]
MKTQTLQRCCLLIAAGFLASLARGDTFGDLLKKHKQTKARFSILAVDAATGKTCYRLSSDELKIPASNMKLVTTAAAVHYLGGDYIFKTQIALLGNDLVVIGGGDPLLGDPAADTAPAQAAAAVVDRIARALKDAGVSQIDNLIVDTSFFDNVRVHPSWPRDQLNQWYACEVSGLNFYDNCIHINAARKGNSALIDMTPANDYVRLVNQIKVISKGDSAIGAYRNATPNHLTLKGKLNRPAGFDVAIENPAGLFASMLCGYLNSSGIAVRGQLLQKYVKNDTSLRSLLTIETPLKDVLKRANSNSLGLAAECLVKTISAEHTQDRINGQWEHGLELTAQYLQSLGIDKSQYVLDDGSGLSRKNRLSAECLVAVLTDMYKGPDSAAFFDSLAVGGIEGTAAKFFGEAPYKGNILGKTGYIAGVRSFSGLCRTPKGDVFFSILTEGGSSATRACINDITRAIFDRRL